MSRRHQSLRLVPVRLDDEPQGGGIEAAAVRSEDEAVVAEHPLPRKHSDVVEDDELFDELEE
jgi:hypothetical protein